MTDSTLDEKIAAVRSAVLCVPGWRVDHAFAETNVAAVDAIAKAALVALADLEASRPTLGPDDPVLSAMVEVERLGRHYSDSEGVPVLEIRTGRLRTILTAALAAAAAAARPDDTERLTRYIIRQDGISRDEIARLAQERDAATLRAEALEAEGLNYSKGFTKGVWEERTRVTALARLKLEPGRLIEAIEQAESADEFPDELFNDADHTERAREIRDEDRETAVRLVPPMFLGEAFKLVSPGNFAALEAKLSDDIAKALTSARAAAERVGAEKMRERAAKVADQVQERAALNAQEIKDRHPSLNLDRLREVDNRMAGQRHAADEIASTIRALPLPGEE